MALRTPPPEIPVVTFLSPNKGDQGLIEFWNTELATYVPLDVGAPHPNTRLYPNFHLGKQAPLPGDEKWAVRTWVTPETSPDWFNYALKFSAEDTAYPIFIRTYREFKSTYQPRPKLSALGALYRMVLSDVGSGYANGVYPNVIFGMDTATAPISEAVAHAVVSADGTIAECVLDFGGEGYAENVGFRVESGGIGTPAEGVAYIQPTTAILVKEETSLYPPDSEFYAQYLQVVRVYETIPGPTLYSTKLDVDGATLTVGTTRKLCSDITTGESIVSSVWTKTTKHQTDDDFICEEVVEVRTLPGNPMESTKIDVDGKILTRTQTYVDSSTIVSDENIATGTWTRKFEEDVEGTNLVSWQVVESRDIPGNAMESTKIDEDGKVIKRTQTYVASSTIISSEAIVAGVWTRKFEEDVDGSNIVSWQVIEVRDLPGNPIPETTFDQGGNEIDTARTMKDQSTITTSETLVGALWQRVTKRAITDLVAWEVVEARDIPGVTIPSAEVDGDEETVEIESTIKDATVIVPGSTEAGGIITTIEQKRISELISEEEVRTRQWLDRASYSVSIPESIIPVEFRASITTTIESHVLAGTASMPTLAAGEFEHIKRQLTRLLYEERITRLTDLTFPITQTGTETSTEYGGAVLDVVRTLDDGLLTADEGEDIVASFVNPIGDNLMWFKETKKRPSGDAEWPVIISSLWDDNMRLQYLESRQVIDVGGGPDPDPGGSVFAWVSEVKGLDKWRSIRINTEKFEPDYVDEASALISYEYKPVRFPGLLYFAVAGYYVRHADATLVQHLVKTWWEKSTNPPTPPAIDEIIMDDVVISSLNNTSTLDYSGPVLHDDLTTFGFFFYPATTPSYTEYALGIPDGTFSLKNVASLYSPGSAGGYVVGDTITIASGGFTMSVDVTFVYDVGAVTGLIGGTTILDPAGTFPAGTYGPILATGGSGSGAYFNVFAYSTPNYTPGTAWIGTYRVIGARVIPEREKDIWKFVTESVVMR